MTAPLSNWSWQDIQATYRSYAALFSEYNGINKRVGVPRQMHIELKDESNLFILRFWRDVHRIDNQLQVLDNEIARRNNLIGVMG